MTETSSSGPAPGGPSPALVDALSSNATRCPADTPVVGADELEQLRSILDGGRSDPRVDRSRAVRALARSDPSAASAAVLARIAANDDESAAVRVNAAAALGTLPPEIGEPHLLELLAVPAAPVRTQVVKQLGWVGGQRSLAALERLEAADPRSDHRRLLARLAVAHRTGAPLEEIDRIRGQLGLSPETIAARPDSGRHADGSSERWETAASQALRTDDAERLVRNLGPRRGLTLGSNVSLEFVCGTERNLVFLSAELAEADLVEALLSKSMNAGVVAVDDYGGIQPGVRFRLLSNPRGDGLEIMAVTSTGEPAFVGTGERTEEGLTFGLHDLDAPVPMEIVGTVTPGSVDLQLRVSDVPPRPANPGMAVDPQRATAVPQ